MRYACELSGVEKRLVFLKPINASPNGKVPHAALKWYLPGAFPPLQACALEMVWAVLPQGGSVIFLLFRLG